MHKSFVGTPFSNSMKIHDEIGNKKENPILIAKSLFENADNYFIASQVILRHDSSLIPVVFTNLAFSCELFLKSILFRFKEDNKKINEHRLYELYKLIPSEQQAEIKRCFESLPGKKDDFDLLFQDVSETFVFARYIHERNSSCFSFELFHLVFAVRNCAKQFYNAQILEENRLELAKFEQRKSKNIEPSLKFWIYYNENHNCNIEEVAKMLVENLCDSLKCDFDNFVFSKRDHDLDRDPAIILNFTRQGYIYNEEYGNIMITSSKIFKIFGMSNKGIRTNGYQITLQKEVE